MFNIFCCKKKSLNERLIKEECPICLEPLNKNAPIILRDCNHIFHKKCLKEHHIYNGYYCPLCMSNHK